MINYAADYFSELSKGISGLTVTDSAGGILRKEDALALCANKMNEVKKKGGRAFFCGNGASATMAEHMSHDWFQNAEIDTYSCSETSHITAISNDISYEDVFCYRVKRILGKEDMIVTISSSGNSPNVIKALEAAKANGAFCVTFSGMKETNKSRTLGDVNFYVPLNTYGLVESSHAVLIHMMLDYYLDKYMGGRH